jgi:RNA polymerase sigma factor (sigma-70 family)
MVHTIRNRVLALLANASGRQAEEGDGQLLHRFVHHRDESAFEALLHRHAGLVWGVCRRSLGHDQDAEDVFQATFLVLAQEAARIRKPEALASWLHGTARRLAQRLKRDLARRRHHELSASQHAESEVSSDLAVPELRELIDEEIARLPAKYREVFTRRVLSGQSKQQIALELGRDPGTIGVHLCRARKQLERQLARRGMALTAALTTAALTPSASVAIPAQVVDTVLQAIHNPLTVLPERIAVLLVGGGRATTRFTTRKVIGFVLVAVTFVAAGAWPLTPRGTPRAGQASSPEKPPASAEPPVASDDIKPEKPPRYFIRLVKTDLQREFAPMKTDIFVLLDATPALSGGKIVKSKLDLANLGKALKQYVKADAKLHFTVFYEDDDQDPDRHDNGDVLRLAMTGFGHWIGFPKVTAWVSTGPARLTWKVAAAPFADTDGGPEGEEPSTTNELARAYPVRTRLSRYLASGADCAVTILPSLDKEGGKIPKKVRDAVSDAVGKVKLGRKKRITFSTAHVRDQKEQQLLINALREFGNELGFVETVVSMR